MSRMRGRFANEQLVRGAVLCFLCVLQARGLIAADFAQAVEKARDAVVTVQVDKRLGTGFIVAADGYIVTSQHILDAAQKAKVLLANGDELEAVVRAQDKEHDLAVLKAERQHLPTVIFASSQRLKQGEPVAALGAPLGLKETLTEGIVAAPAREIDGRKYIQLDVALTEGNSGSPIINAKGFVVGMATAVAKKAEKIGFAIPSDEVMAFLEKSGISYTTLDEMPKSEAGSKATSAPSDSAKEEAPEAAAPMAPAPTAPIPEQSLPRALAPWQWLVLSAVISLIVAMLTSLLVAKRAARAALRGGPGAIAAENAPPPPPTGGWATPSPPPTPSPSRPAAPETDDLSDIDIELK